MKATVRVNNSNLKIIYKGKHTNKKTVVLQLVMLKTLLA